MTPEAFFRLTWRQYRLLVEQFNKAIKAESSPV